MLFDKFVGVRTPYQMTEWGHIYSVVNFWEIIKFILEGFGVNSLCEVGVENALLFRQMATADSFVDISYTAIDPKLTSEAKANIRELGGEIIADYSSAGIARAPLHECYIIDADHNYYNVSCDLNAIIEKAKGGAAPLILLHDVCWPTDRRDAYYDPEKLPPDACDACKVGMGLSLGEELLVRGGFLTKKKKGDYCFGESYGKPRRGVLTAVEDYMRRNSGWQLLIIPGNYGLGVLFSIDNLTSAQRSCVRELALGINLFGGLLEQLEYNRLENCARRYELEMLVKSGALANA